MNFSKPTCMYYIIMWMQNALMYLACRHLIIPWGYTRLSTAECGVTIITVSYIQNNVYLLYNVSFSLPFTFSMLALPCSKIHKMKGFVTMEKVILSILPMLWQVSFHLSLLLFPPSSLCPGLHASSAPPLLLSQLPSLLLSWGMTANNTCNVQVWRQILRARSQDFSVSHSNFDHSFVNRSLTSSLTFWEWSTKPLEDWYKFYAWSLI